MSNRRYEFTPADRALYNPKLLYITHSVYGADWHSTPHFHPFTEILFITKGSGEFSIDKHHCQIRRGDMVIISPNHLHTEHSNKKEAMEYYIVGIDNLLFDIMKEDFDEEKVFFPVFNFLNHYEKANYYLQTMYQEIEKKSTNYELVVESILSVFIIHVMRHTNLAFTALTNADAASKECMFVKKYIDSHFAYEINLDDLCQKVFISKYHLIHSFKKAYGVSPIQYLIKRRITEGKSLIKTTNLSISEISRTVGFSSPHHFTKKFFEENQVSPSQLRKSPPPED